MKYIASVVLASLVWGAVLPGCSKKEGESTPTTADAGVSQTSANLDGGSRTVEVDGGDPMTALLGTGDTHGITSRSDERFPRLGALDKIAVEKIDRPQHALKVETVFDAIESQLKMPVTRKRPVVAYTVKAGYCQLADVDPGITLCACEYDDEKSLVAGRQPARALKLPNREIVENRLATLAIQRGDTTPEINAKAEKIADFFKKLPAPPIPDPPRSAAPAAPAAPAGSTK